jgi:hypothetical protein
MKKLQSSISNTSNIDGWNWKGKKTQIYETKIIPHKANWKKKYEIQFSKNLILNDKIKKR